MSSSRACIAGPTAAVLHRIYLDASDDFLAVLLGHRLERTTSEATDTDVAKVTASTDFVVSSVFVVEQEDETKFEEKPEFLGFLSFRKGWPEGAPPLASHQDRRRMAALAEHLPAKARLYCLVTEVACPTTLGVKHVTSVLVVEGEEETDWARIPLEVTTLGEGGGQRYQVRTRWP